MQSFDVFFVISLEKLSNKQFNCQWFDDKWPSYDIIVIKYTHGFVVLQWYSHTWQIHVFYLPIRFRVASLALIMRMTQCVWRKAEVYWWSWLVLGVGVASDFKHHAANVMPLKCNMDCLHHDKKFVWYSVTIHLVDVQESLNDGEKWYISFCSICCMQRSLRENLCHALTLGNPMVITLFIKQYRKFTLIINFNSLWPSDTIWPHGSVSTLAQVMACCLMAPNHYLNQHWLMMNGVLWHMPTGNFTENDPDINSQHEFKNTRQIISTPHIFIMGVRIPGEMIFIL